MAGYANTVYIDPTAGSDGSGSFASPRNVWPATIANDTEYLFKHGTTLTRTNQQFATGFRNNIRLADYGPASDPLPRLFGNHDVGVDANHTLEAAGTNIIIERLKIERTVPSGSFGRAALLVTDGASANVLVQDCELVGGFNGLRIQQNAVVVAQRNRIYGQREDGIWMRAGNGTQILGNVIYDWNNGSDAGDGIQTSEDTGVITIAGNVLTIPAVTIKMGILAQSLANTGAQYIVARNRVHSLSLSGGTLGPHVLLQGSGMCVGNVCTGPMFRGVSIETGFAGQTAIASGNVCIAEQETDEADVYGVLVGGVNQDKTVRVWNNTLIGRFSRPIYLTAWTAGTTFEGGNNHVDARGRSAVTAYRNDTGRSLTALNDNLIGCPGGNSNTGMTHTGVNAFTSPGLDTYGRPLAGSPLIAAGAAAAGYSLDSDGNLRWLPPSIGAYEYHRPRTAR
jgi:hypothetical protein